MASLRRSLLDETIRSNTQPSVNSGDSGVRSSRMSPLYTTANLFNGYRHGGPRVVLKLGDTRRLFFFFSLLPAFSTAAFFQPRYIYTHISFLFSPWSYGLLFFLLLVIITTNKNERTTTNDNTQIQASSLFHSDTSSRDERATWPRGGKRFEKIKKGMCRAGGGFFPLCSAATLLCRFDSKSGRNRLSGFF